MLSFGDNPYFEVPWSVEYVVVRLALQEYRSSVY